MTINTNTEEVPIDTQKSQSLDILLQKYEKAKEFISSNPDDWQSKAASKIDIKTPMDEYQKLCAEIATIKSLESSLENAKDVNAANSPIDKLSNEYSQKIQRLKKGDSLILPWNEWSLMRIERGQNGKYKMIVYDMQQPKSAIIHKATRKYQIQHIYEKFPDKKLKDPNFVKLDVPIF